MTVKKSDNLGNISQCLKTYIVIALTLLPAQLTKADPGVCGKLRARYDVTGPAFLDRSFRDVAKPGDQLNISEKIELNERIATGRGSLYYLEKTNGSDSSITGSIRGSLRQEGGANVFKIDVIRLTDSDSNGRQIPSTINVAETKINTSMLAILRLYHASEKQLGYQPLAALEFGQVVNIPTVLKMAIQEKAASSGTNEASPAMRSDFFRKSPFFYGAREIADRLGYRTTKVEIVGGKAVMIKDFQPFRSGAGGTVQEALSEVNRKNSDLGVKLDENDYIFVGFDVRIGVE